MATESDQNPKPGNDCRDWVELHGDALFRYALLHLSDREVAEDMVQEAFLAALKARETYSGGSTERTWLIGILKHKIADHFRKMARRAGTLDLSETAELVSDQFSGSCKWRVNPQKWNVNPATAFENEEFWDVFAFCMAALPERIAHTFALRELGGHTTDEICEILGLSATNLWTLLHRARTRLRKCLESNWFRREL